MYAEARFSDALADPSDPINVSRAGAGSSRSSSHRGSNRGRVQDGRTRASIGCRRALPRHPDRTGYTTAANNRCATSRRSEIALTKAVFEAVADDLETRGVLLRGGTIVDATLIVLGGRRSNQLWDNVAQSKLPAPPTAPPPSSPPGIRPASCEIAGRAWWYDLLRGESGKLQMSNTRA
jgi:hypothetical protein